MKSEIKRLRAQLNGLNNDAWYWDLVRTHGEYSREVLSHLRTCAEYQKNQSAVRAQS